MAPLAISNKKNRETIDNQRHPRITWVKSIISIPPKQDLESEWVPLDLLLIGCQSHYYSSKFYQKSPCNLERHPKTFSNNSFFRNAKATCLILGNLTYCSSLFQLLSQVDGPFFNSLQLLLLLPSVALLVDLEATRKDLNNFWWPIGSKGLQFFALYQFNICIYIYI